MVSPCESNSPNVTESVSCIAPKLVLLNKLLSLRSNSATSFNDFTISCVPVTSKPTVVLYKR